MLINHVILIKTQQNTRMYKRSTEPVLHELLQQYPAVVLLGPRQVGKTTLALAEGQAHAGSLYLDLELPSVQRQLDDPEAFLLTHRNRLVHECANADC